MEDDLMKAWERALLFLSLLVAVAALAVATFGRRSEFETCFDTCVKANTLKLGAWWRVHL
jgi:hypothetical protein